MKKHFLPSCALLIAILLTGGCSPQPTTPGAEFGASVRKVMGNQIHDTEAAINHDPNAVEGGDPYRLDAALNTHRSDVSKPQEVQQPIIINAR